MSIRSADEIYNVLERALEDADQPQTCAALMERADVRQAALARFSPEAHDVQIATNKLSDILGFMWRRGVLTRFPAPSTVKSQARFAYLLNRRQPSAEKVPLPPPSKKPTVLVTRGEDDVTLEFERFQVIIRAK